MEILFSAFKRKLTSEIKVAQFSGYVSEHSAYHHGEASLNGAIVNMAQIMTKRIPVSEDRWKELGRIKEAESKLLTNFGGLIKKSPSCLSNQPVLFNNPFPSVLK